MAITTLDALAFPSAQIRLPFYKTGTTPAVVAGGWSSQWSKAGNPSAGSLSVGNTTTGAVPTKATTGAPTFSNPTGGALTYLVGMEAASSQVLGVTLFDRVWHAGSFTPTSGAIAGFTGATTPDRPAAGAFEIWAEINTALSAAAHTVTLTYVNEGGTGSRTATIVLPASAPQGRLYQAELQGSDMGAQSLSAISGSATPPTGSYNILLLRRLATVAVPLANNWYFRSALDLNAPQIYDDSCLMLGLLTTGTTAPNPLNVTITLAQG